VRASWVTRPPAGIIETVINSHPPHLQGRHYPHLVTILRVVDESSRLPTRRTTTATARDHICPSRNPAFWLAEIPRLPGTELCPNLKYQGMPPERLEIRGKFQVGELSEVREPQTVCFNHGRPTRHLNPQLSPPPPFGKENGIKERSDEQEISSDHESKRISV